MWFTLFGSAGLGLLIMLTRFVAGENVLLSDFGIQLTSLLFFAGLIYIERGRGE